MYILCFVYFYFQFDVSVRTGICSGCVCFISAASFCRWAKSRL